MSDGLPPTANLVLVLNPNILIVRAAEYPEDTRNRLGGTLDDYVLSERRSRYSALRISAETAQFVQRFAAPMRFLDAVVAHSEETGEDPFSLLESVFPFVTQLQAQRILLPPSDVRPVAVEPRFRVGDNIGGWRILHCIEAQNETEIYRVENAEVGRGALKWVPADGPAFVRSALNREESVLRLLEARGMAAVPRVLGRGSVAEEGAFLVLSWWHGTNLNDLQRGDTPPLATRLVMAERVVTMYEELHRRGVLHGDVHGGNILSDEHGEMALIDFGSARRLDEDDHHPRAGVLTDYEPEAAHELVEGRAPALATPLGEQYCVAALVFRLITRMPCLRLSLESATALRQIVEQRPRPFADAGMRWPSLETVLRRALSKTPEQRFASLADFRVALKRALADRPLDIEANVPVAARSSRRTALKELLRVYGPDSGLIDAGLAQGPTCSLYYGATGVAYALLRASILEESATALDSADAWIEQAIALSATASAYENPEVGILSSEIAPTSVFHRMIGTHAIRAMVRYVSGDLRGASLSIQAFLDAISSVDSSLDRRFVIDLMNGPASHLQAATMLYSLCVDVDASIRQRLFLSIDELSATVVRNLASVRIASVGDDRCYVGMAHGVAGSLFALNQGTAVGGGPVSRETTDALDWLAAQATEVSGGLAWPVNAGPQPSAPWTGWCHGSAGHVILWAFVAKLRGRTDDRDRAIGAAQHLWTNRQHANPTLCCGLAGEALSLCEAARVSGDSIWIDRAHALFEKRPASFDPIAPHSLFRGHLGILLTALELQHAERSAFPLSAPIIPDSSDTL